MLILKLTEIYNMGIRIKITWESQCGYNYMCVNPLKNLGFVVSFTMYQLFLQ